MEVQANRAAPGIHSLLGLSVSWIAAVREQKKNILWPVFKTPPPFIKMLTAASAGLGFCCVFFKLRVGIPHKAASKWK